MKLETEVKVTVVYEGKEYAVSESGYAHGLCLPPNAEFAVSYEGVFKHKHTLCDLVGAKIEIAGEE